MTGPRKPAPKPTAPKAAPAPSNLEDLLALTSDDLKSEDTKPVNLGAEGTPEPTPEPQSPTPIPSEPREVSVDDRIAALTAQVEALIKLASAAPVATVVNNYADNPSAGTQEVAAPENLVPTDENDVILHFLEDGVTGLDKVWYRGEQLRIRKDSAAWKSTQDRNGDSWLDTLDNIPLQWKKWGKQIIARGPWPGLSLLEVPVPEEYTVAQGEEFKAGLRRAAEIEAEKLNKPLERVDNTY